MADLGVNVENVPLVERLDTEPVSAQFGGGNESAQLPIENAR